MATSAIAWIAGGAPATALRLGLAMTFLQFAIGAANDIADAPADRGRRDKPLPNRLVAIPVARALALACGALGLGLAAGSGPAVLALALAGLGLGLAYDGGLKRTALAWLPFAVGIPLLVVFAWFGATGTLTPAVLVLVPTGALAGAALALGNALVDPTADRTAGLITPVLALGPALAWRSEAALLAATVGLAAGSLVVLGTPDDVLVAAVGAGLLAAIGVLLARDGRRQIRERGWELEAVGMALLGASWMAGVAATGR